MATKIFPSANDINGGVSGDGKTLKEINFSALFRALVGDISHIISGFVVPSSGSLSAYTIPAGEAIVVGRYVQKTTNEDVVLTDNATNYIYLQLTLDGSSNATAANFVVNTSGAQPSNSMSIAKVVTAGGVVSSAITFGGFMLAPVVGGAGTGIGVYGTGGGATNGAGVYGVGGTTNGVGVRGSGTGSGQGVYGVGGATNGVGVQGLGTGSGQGIYGTGGATNGAGVQGLGTGSGSGVYGTGGATNGYGVQGLGAGTGPGVYGVGGATNGIGVYGTGTGSGSGVYGSSASVVGIGVQGVSNNYIGVYGSSANGIGVCGVSTNSDGVYCQSITGSALHLSPQPTPTTNLSNGNIYYNSTDHKLYVRSNSAWVVIGTQT